MKPTDEAKLIFALHKFERAVRSAEISSMSGASLRQMEGLRDKIDEARARIIDLFESKKSGA